MIPVSTGDYGSNEDVAGRGCGILLIEQHRFEALAHMPFNMAGDAARGALPEGRSGRRDGPFRSNKGMLL
jgi:hypothetical protein